MEKEDTIMSQAFVTIETLAKHFSVSISTIRLWIKQNYIPNNTYIKLGQTYRFNLPLVSAALEKASLDVNKKTTPITEDSSVDNDV